MVTSSFDSSSNPNPSSSSTFSLWFKQLVKTSLEHNLCPDRFLVKLNAGLLKNPVDSSCLNEESARIISYASLTNGAFKLALEYLQILYFSEYVDDDSYLSFLMNFRKYDYAADLKTVVDHFKKFISYSRCSFMNEFSCSKLAKRVFSILDCLFSVLHDCVTNETLIPNRNLFHHVLKCALGAIEWLFSDIYSSLAISFQMANDSEKKKILDKVDKIYLTLKQIYHNGIYQQTSFEKEADEDNFSHGPLLKDIFLEGCLFKLKNIEEILKMDEFLFNNINDTCNKWHPYREDFICRRHRPAIITLGSIFANFLVLKSAEEMADSFLTVGDVLGYSHRRILSDILRSAFLVQLETSHSDPNGDRETMADMYLYIKVPQILNQMKQYGVKSSDVHSALDEICNCTKLLDELDIKKKANTFGYFLDELKKVGLIDDSYSNLLMEKRKKLSHSTQVDCLSNFISNIALIETGKKATKTFSLGIHSVQEKAKWCNAIKKAMQSYNNDIIVDIICSLFCVDGKLSNLSNKLAILNASTEQPSNDSNDPCMEERPFIFDYTFLLLSRILYVYTDLRLDELVNGSSNSNESIESDNRTKVFYKWTSNYLEKLGSGIPIPVDEKRKEKFMSQFNLMKQQKQPYWSGSDAFGDVIELTTLVGSLLFDQYRRGSPDPTDISNVLLTFRSMPCLLLTLVQWMETQTPSVPRQALARAIRDLDDANSANKRTRVQQQPGTTENRSWTYVLFISRKRVRNMSEGVRQKKHHYPWPIGFVQQPLSSSNLCPYQTTEVPDEQTIKDAFMQAFQRGWASPDIISFINFYNKAVKHNIWCHCWMRQMMKQSTADEMEVAAELCLAAALTYPVACLMEMTKKIVDAALFDMKAPATEQHETSESTTKVSWGLNPAPLAIEATVLAKLLLHVLTLLLWAEDRRQISINNRKSNRISSRKRKLDHQSLSLGGRELEGPKCEANNEKFQDGAKQSTADSCLHSMPSDSGKFAEKLETGAIKEAEPSRVTPVEATIKGVFDRFQRVLDDSCLKPSTTFIIFFIHALAKAPKSVYRERLVKKMPMSLVYSLARLDASALPIGLFMSLYEPCTYRLECLKYAIMMRKFGLLKNEI